MTGISDWPDDEQTLAESVYRELDRHPLITSALHNRVALIDALKQWRDTAEAHGVIDRHLRLIVNAVPMTPEYFLGLFPAAALGAAIDHAKLQAVPRRPDPGPNALEGRLWVKQAIGIGPIAVDALRKWLWDQGDNVTPEQREALGLPLLLTPRRILEGLPQEVGRHALELSYLLCGYFYVALVSALKAQQADAGQTSAQETPVETAAAPPVPAAAPATPVAAPSVPAAAPSASPTAPGSARRATRPPAVPDAQSPPSVAAPTPAPAPDGSAEPPQPGSSVPVVQGVPAESAAVGEPADPQAVDPAGFAGYLYAERGEAAKASLTRTLEGQIKVMWPPHDASCIFRLVSADGAYPPYSPDEATLHAATLGTVADDAVPRSQAIRHYQVWRHDGPDIAQAKLAQPVLHAELSSASPVTDVEFREEDDGRLIAQWRAMPGTERVHVYRVPAEIPSPGIGDPAFRIAEHGDNLGGFVDSGAEPGKRYRYAIAAEVEIGGVPVLSSPVVKTWELQTRLGRITDLSFTLYDAPGAAPCFDLSWTATDAGTTSIYRTAQPPQAGISRAELPEAALEGAGLREADRLVHPVSVNGGAATMSTVSWPIDWTRAYFTPVVSHGSRALVGETVSGVRVPPVEEPMLQDRLHRQLLTFEWPAGAASVQVYQVATGADFGAAYSAGPVRVLESEESYRAGGGLVFERGQLATDLHGCDLTLIGVAYEGAQPYVSAPSSVHYTPVVPIEYRLQYSRSFTGAPNGVTVELLSREYEIPMQLNFALVANSDRMPLNPVDGTPIAMQQNVEQPGAPVTMFPAGPFPAGGSPAVSWKSDASSFKEAAQGGGYLRLFLYHQPPGPRVALLDPGASQLTIGRKLPWMN